MQRPDLTQFEAELKELSGHARLKLTQHTDTGVAISMRECDQADRYGYDININHKRIRTESQLQGHLDWIRGQLS